MAIRSGGRTLSFNLLISESSGDGKAFPRTAGWQAELAQLRGKDFEVEETSPAIATHRRRSDLSACDRSGIRREGPNPSDDSENGGGDVEAEIGVSEANFRYLHASSVSVVGLCQWTVNGASSEVANPANDEKGMEESDLRLMGMLPASWRLPSRWIGIE